MNFIPTPLDLLFQSYANLSEQQILTLGHQLDWQAPQSTLVRYASRFHGRTDGTMDLVWPMVCLLRSGSPRLKKLLLTAAAVPLDSSTVMIRYPPHGNDLEPPDFWNLAAQTALEHLDLASFKTILELLPPTEAFSKLFSHPRLSVFRSFGFACNPANSHNSQAAVEIIKLLKTFAKNNAPAYFLSGWKGKNKIPSFLADLQGAILNLSILNKRGRDWGKFWLTQPATCAPLTLLSALAMEDLPVAQQVLATLRTRPVASPNTYWLAGFTKSSTSLSSLFHALPRPSDHLNPDNYFSAVINAYPAFLSRNLAYAHREAQDQPDREYLTTNCTKKQQYLDEFLLFACQDGLTFPGFDNGVNLYSVIEAASASLSPSGTAETKWLGLLGGTPISPVEFHTLFVNQRFALLRQRLTQTVALGGQLPHFINELATLFNQHLPNFLHSDHREKLTDNLTALAQLWPALQTIDPACSPASLAALLKMDSSVATHFTLAVASQLSPASASFPPLRL